jgi:O-6-methylguanine DNA methyltransferase
MQALVVKSSRPLESLTAWRVPTPWGEFAAVLAEDGGLAAISFPRKKIAEAAEVAIASARLGHPRASISSNGTLPVNSPVLRQIEEYIGGKRKSFDLCLAFGEQRDFDLDVWRATAKIPQGKTCSYGELGSLIGRPRAARAIGGALGRNPVPLIVPCHRVVRADGKIGGFSGGSGWKEKLLGFEGIS